MNNGDRVTGVPSEPDMRASHPTVTGTYSLDKVNFMGKTFPVELVMVGDVGVSCDGIRPANRREKDTVLS